MGRKGGRKASILHLSTVILCSRASCTIGPYKEGNPAVGKIVESDAYETIRATIRAQAGRPACWEQEGGVRMDASFAVYLAPFNSKNREVRM